MKNRVQINFGAVFLGEEFYYSQHEYMKVGKESAIKKGSDERGYFEQTVKVEVYFFKDYIKKTLKK